MTHPILLFFFFNDTATTEIYTLSLHDALPISPPRSPGGPRCPTGASPDRTQSPPPPPPPACADRSRRSRERSEEHTSELQSPCNLVCRLLLEKKKKKDNKQQLCEQRNRVKS